MFGAKTLVTNKPEDLRLCKKAVLPGVGAFDDAMQELEKRKLIPEIRRIAKERKPFLGICLGMQLFFEESEEARFQKGLGLLKGKVVRIKQSGKLKVPHMGWNQIKVRSQNSKVEGGSPLLAEIKDDSFVYFCHSYYPVPKDKDSVAATCDYGVVFACAVNKDNIYGVQFHPEKSQGVGLKMLENFVNLC